MAPAAAGTQVSEPDALYGVDEMADMLFSETGPVHMYATHRLLREDRRLFKQAGRQPPMYQPRLQAEGEALQAQEEAMARVRAPAIAYFLSFRA